MTQGVPTAGNRRMSPLSRLIGYCIDNKLIVTIVVLGIVVWGIMVAPFDWSLAGLPRDPVPVDAIPDIGENQQIVFTEWKGRSPEDVENQITYPLTTALLGIPGVRTVRSYSYFGFSSIYIIFEEDAEFYWSRTRVLEKLNSLPPNTVPQGARPTLGPDATGLGQVFWYTLEGRDEEGNPTGGWDLNELRSVQDWTVRYALLSAHGVAEVSSVGGFVQEYQIDVNPEALLSHDVTLTDVFGAVKASNVDVGARTIEINRVEYVIRGLGFIKSIADIENSVIRQSRNVPVRIADVATVSLGPASRRGALDKGGAEVVGGVVVARYGENPLAAINNVKVKIAQISEGLPKRTLPDGRVSQITIVPFYDRSQLIYQTLGTLNTALIDEILVTIIVVLIMIAHLRSSLLISGMLPLTVLMVFIGMRVFKVDANIVALSGIAIAIGTIVDMGIIICENILRHIRQAPPDADRRALVFTATTEVSGAVLTAVATTVISFLPVFTLHAAEGKLFQPLAYTKTFALIASIIVALTVIPPFAHLLFTRRVGKQLTRVFLASGLVIGAVLAFWQSIWVTGIVLIGIAAYLVLQSRIPAARRSIVKRVLNAVIILALAVLLSRHWLPLGVSGGEILNFLFVVVLLGGLLLVFLGFIRGYEPMLRWCLAHKRAFLAIPVVLILFGLTVWGGFDSATGFLPGFVRSSAPFERLSRAFPGLGKEFMPDLDEGSFLYMPTTMPHASIGEALDVLRHQDMAFSAIPEVETVVGKIGRTDSALDPAPISMIETVINYKPEYKVGPDGRRLRFKYDRRNDRFERDASGELIPDRRGKPFRNWRDHIRKPSDIWDEIVKAGRMPGTTSAPRLQPIAARIVMLQSGMRAPMGIKVKGPDLETIEQVGLEIERLLREVPTVEPAAVAADRIIGKPYLEIDINREAIARYGINIERVQNIVEVAIGGKTLTTTVEGRERYPVRVRYQRELRNTIEDLENILIPAPDGVQIPLSELAIIEFVRGPMVIKSEDTFLVGYVVFDKRKGNAEVDVVEDAREHIQTAIDSGTLAIPAGVSYEFTGSYENQVRSERTLMVVLPLALVAIFLIIYLQFKHVPTTLLVFSGIFVAWAGGFVMLWLYGQDWFMNVTMFGIDFRELFQIRTFNLSVAVWVGFLALFGIATDDGVIISTYLKQVFLRRRPASIEEVREATVEAGKRRIRPALMTAATTLLALIPVLTSTGRGADIMVPMAIPSFGGMAVVLLRVLTVPVLFAWLAEARIARHRPAYPGAGEGH